MRYTPVAVALSLALAITSSGTFGAPRVADPRAAALQEEGRALMAQGQVHDAVTAFEAALAVDPGHTAVYLDLAEAARRDGMQGKAIHYYRVALERDPENLAAISGEGEALVEKGAVEKARRNLARLEAICGRNCDETRQLAAALQKAPAGPPVLRAELVIPEVEVTKN